jgi:hypothetical protein
MVFGMAFVVGTLGILGLASRQAIPRVERLSIDAVGAGEPLKFTESVAGGRLWSQPDGSVSVTLRLTAASSEPGVIAYWVPGDESIGKQLPETNYLLGHVDAASVRRFVVPRVEPGHAGSVVLFGLNQQRVLDHASVELPPAAPRGPA